MARDMSGALATSVPDCIRPVYKERYWLQGDLVEFCKKITVLANVFARKHGHKPVREPEVFQQVLTQAVHAFFSRAPINRVTVIFSEDGGKAWEYDLSQHGSLSEFNQEAEEFFKENGIASLPMDKNTESAGEEKETQESLNNKNEEAEEFDPMKFIESPTE